MAAPPRITGPKLLLLALLAAAGVAALLGRFGNRQPEPLPQPPPEELTLDEPVPDPRLTFPTPFRNVKPGVRYLGDASCANCHKTVSEKYHAHPMGRSAELTTKAMPIERYDAGANNPFRSGPFTPRVEKTADKVMHHVAAKDSVGAALPEYALTADLAIGSGARGRSYLTIQKGAVWQTPISWYSAKSAWDLSPGFNLGNGGRWSIHSDCLFCHVDRVEPVLGSVNRYREPLLPIQAAIGCERCHGPGELHVAARTSGEAVPIPDTSIVNPKHLAPELQASVCEQCHLQGQERVARRGREVFEFRPGLPFEQFVTVFVRHPEVADASHSGGQFEQVERSKCFIASAGRLTCTSCHDPHTTPTPANREAFYRTKCQTCHEWKGCSLPAPARREKDDSCLTCHMPRGDSSNIAHASMTDHRILRRPLSASPPRSLPAGTPPLFAFRIGPHAPPEAERERDLGIVLARLTEKIPSNAGNARATVSELAANRLTRSLQTWKGDPDAWTALSIAHAAHGNLDDRLTAATSAARLAPHSDPAQMQLAEAALASRRFDEAVDAATKLIERNQTALEPLLTRTMAFMQQREWAKAEADTRAILRIHPLHPQGRIYLAVSLHKLGDVAGGRREADTAAGLATSPQQRLAMLDWYQQQTR